MPALNGSSDVRRVAVIDTHTGGEPTRVVIDGGPDLGSGSLVERRRIFSERFDEFRSAVVNEPRGSDVMVGALLCSPVNADSAAGVIFFNNVGCLNMCGHGTMGVAVALAHLGRIGPGRHRLDTPVGQVAFELEGRNRVTIENVPASRLRRNVTVEVEGHGPVTGDVAWGGNWFFIAELYEPVQQRTRQGAGETERGGDLETLLSPAPCMSLTPANVNELTTFATRIRRTLEREGITGAAGAVIDHIELSGPPLDPRNHSRNFVLCPGGAYDRSPCGTGTSAKLACLFADGKLKPGETYRQESIIGSLFEGQVRLDGDELIPLVTGTAYVNAETTLAIDPEDPFRFGIRTG